MIPGKPPKVRVGVIGVGWVATARHIPAFKRDGRAEILALLDSDRTRAEPVARQLKVPYFSDRTEEFFQQPLDVISICTPPQTHASLIEAALKAGKHVLVEKPMTLTSQEGRTLEALAQQRGVILCPTHNFQFSRSAERAKALLLSGKAGDIHSAMGIQLSSWRRRLPTWFDGLPGGLFFDEGPHLLYLMRRFLEELHLEKAWHTSEGKESSRMEARFHGARGTGYLSMWFGAPFSEWLFILFCSRAVLVLDLFRDILVHLPPERGHNARDVLKTSVLGTAGFWRGVADSAVRSLRGQLLYGHDRLVKLFLDAVIGSGEPPVAAEEGWKVVALMEDILRSSGTTG